MLTQGPSSPLKFLFLHLISYTQLLSFLKKTKVICCRVKSTRLCFEFRRLHNDFLPQVWGRGRNRTSSLRRLRDAIHFFNFKPFLRTSIIDALDGDISLQILVTLLTVEVVTHKKLYSIWPNSLKKNTQFVLIPTLTVTKIMGFF